MARPPEAEYPDEIESDREIRPLSSDGNRIPTAFIVIAIVAGLLVLVALQLLGGGDRGAQVNERPTFTPSIDSDLELPRPSLPITPPEPEPEPEIQDAFNEMNALEMERLRQLAILEEQRFQLMQAQAAEAAAERQRRLQSSMLVVDRGGTAPTTADREGAAGGFNPADFGAGQFVEQDPNERNELITDEATRFLRDASNEKVVSAQAVKLADQDYLLTQGTFISGVLETMINSDLPGMARAIVDQNVYGRTGNRIVVPKGSRLIGRYQSGIDWGQARVYIVWTRLERPDGVVINIGSPGTDPIGQAGLGGDVDNHFFQRFGAATLFSALGPAMAALLEDDNQSANTQEIIQGGRDGFERSSEIVLRQSINIPPTIRVPQGTEITIFVNRDLSFNYSRN